MIINETFETVTAPWGFGTATGLTTSITTAISPKTTNTLQWYLNAVTGSRTFSKSFNGSSNLPMPSNNIVKLDFDWYLGTPTGTGNGMFLRFKDASGNLAIAFSCDGTTSSALHFVNLNNTVTTDPTAASTRISPTSGIFDRSTWVSIHASLNFTTHMVDTLIVTNQAGTSTYTKYNTAFYSSSASGIATFEVYANRTSGQNLTWTGQIDNFKIYKYTDLGTLSVNYPTCGNTDITLASSATAPSGETFYWQTSTLGTSTSAPTPYITSTAGTYYLRAYTSASALWSDASTGVTVVSDPVGGTSTAVSSSMNSGSSTTISLTGYTGNIQWQQSADGTNDWINVTGGSGGTTATYTTPALTSTTYYRALVSIGCTSTTSTTSTVTISSKVINIGDWISGNGNFGNQIINTTSGEHTFTVSGSNLDGDIVLVPPTGFEISTISGSGFVNSTSNITLTPNNGTVSPTAIYVRFVPDALSIYSGNITINSPNTLQQTKIVSGNSIAVEPTVPATGITASNVSTKTIDLSWNAGDGTRYLILYSANSDVATANPPIDGISYTTGNITASGYVVGYVGTATTTTISGLLANTHYYFAVFTYNNSNTAGAENYLLSSPVSTDATTATAFVPTLNVFYKIVQNSSNLVVGTSGTQPVVQTPASTGTSAYGQLFTFIPVPGLTDTYYIKNYNGNYLNKKTSDGYSTIYEATTNSTSSQWVINGTEVNNIRLRIVVNGATNSYLASDGTPSNGNYFFCNKLVDNANGLFTLNVGTITPSVVSEKNIVIEIEKDLKPSPVFITGSASVQITAPAGFTATPSIITPVDFVNNAGTVKVDLNVTTAAIGATGTFDFAYNNGSTMSSFQTLAVKAVPTYIRYYIKHKTSGYYVGNLSTDNKIPALTTKANQLSQMFILRRVNPTVSPNDNIYYIMQDSTYRMLRKSTANGYDSEYGTSGTEAQWTLASQTNETFSFKNATSAKYLGTDNNNSNTRLFVDKTFTLNASSAPYCEWIINDIKAIWNGTGNWDDITKWNIDGNWSKWKVPTSGSVIVNSGELIVNSNIAMDTIIVAPKAQLTLNSTKTLSLTELKLKSDATGIGTYVDKNLNTELPTVNSVVEQYLTGITATGYSDNWWYISSPVTGATSAIFNPGSTATDKNLFGYYDETTSSYPQITTNNVTLKGCVGYLVKLGGAVGTAGTYTFTGRLHNGDTTIIASRTGTSSSKRGFNLIGNPYPSYLDWNAVTDLGNISQRADIRPTIWYRTRTASGVMDFDTFDGEIGTNKGVNGTVSQYIPPMQAFWMKVTDDNTNPTITFTNAMRSHQNQSLSNSRLKVPADNNRLVIRLQITNGINRDVAIIATNPNAVDGYDYYDSEKMSNNNPAIPEIYSIVDNEELVIDKIKSVENGKSIVLGFRPGGAGNFTIEATEITNLDSNIKMIMVDKQNNTEQELTVNAPYSFSSDGAMDNDRFSILFKSAYTNTSFNDANIDHNVLVYCNNSNQICIQNINCVETLLLGLHYN